MKRMKFRGKKSDKCFICQKPSHFAKNCPNKSKKDKLMFHLLHLAPDICDSDIKSIFSLDDEQTPGTNLSIAYSYSEAKDDPSPSLVNV